MKATYTILLTDGQQRVTSIDTEEGGDVVINDSVIAIDLGPGKAEYTYPLANVLEIITTVED